MPNLILDDRIKECVETIKDKKLGSFCFFCKNSVLNQGHMCVCVCNVLTFGIS